MDNQVVVMTLANEHYGIGISTVAEIIKLQPITFVPRAPAFVEGVTNLRGKVLPVIDLRKRFGLSIAEAGKNTRIVVVEMAGTLVGMLVDAVSEVLRVPEGAIEPPSPIVTTIDSTFISGIAKVGNRLIILIDLDQVLRPGEKAELKQVLQPASEPREGTSPGGKAELKQVLQPAPEPREGTSLGGKAELKQVLQPASEPREGTSPGEKAELQQALQPGPELREEAGAPEAEAPATGQAEKEPSQPSVPSPAAPAPVKKGRAKSAPAPAADPGRPRGRKKTTASK